MCRRFDPGSDHFRLRGQRHLGPLRVSEVFVFGDDASTEFAAVDRIGGMHVILHERFRRNVLAILDAEGITRTELARRLGVKNPTVFRYLSPQGSCPGLDVVEKYAKALGIEDPSDLLLADAPVAAH